MSLQVKARELSCHLLQNEDFTEEDIRRCFAMNLQELLAINIDISATFQSFLTILKIISVSKTGPIGIANYINLVLKDIKREDMLYGINNLIKEIEDSFLQETFKVINTIDVSDIDIINKQLYIKYVATMTNILTEDFCKDPNEKDLLLLLELVKFAKARGFSIEYHLETIFSLACNYLIKQYELEPNNIEIKKHISIESERMYLLLVELKDDSFRKSQQKLFKTIEESVELTHNNELKCENISRTKKYHKKELIYESIKASYTVKIYKEFFKDKTPFAVKEYSKISPKVERIIDKEIEILLKLSDRARKDNCFLEVYHFERQSDKIMIFMEYHTQNLAD